MAKKSTKTSKAQRKRAAKRNKLIRQFAIYGVIIAICIICLVMIPIMNRPVDRQTAWTPAVGAVALDAAPVASATPTPGPRALAAQWAVLTVLGLLSLLLVAGGSYTSFIYFRF